MTLDDHDHRNRDWDQNRTTELKALRACGLSCGEIGQMGFSRNSIIGKLYRMGFGVPQEVQDTWTDAETKTLKDCWAAGHSVKEVGEELLKKHNTQRSDRAIRAKAERLHLAKRSVERRKPLPRLIQLPVDEPKPPRDTTVSLNIPFMRLESMHCREVTGTGKDGLATYCGHRRAEGYSYCVHHRNINIYKSNPSMRRL